MQSQESASRQFDLFGTAPWTRRFLFVVLIGFSIGAIGNVAMEARYGPEAQALLVRESGELGTVTGTEPSSLRGRYWVASVVHDVAWSGVVVVPDGSLISGSRFRNLADVDVRVEDYDPTLAPDAVDSLSGLPAIQGVGNLVGNGDFTPFTVVWSEGGVPVPVLRLWFSEGSMLLIDDRVVMTDVGK